MGLGCLAMAIVCSFVVRMMKNFVVRPGHRGQRRVTGLSLDFHQIAWAYR
jgi:hypothetical protein